MKWKPNRYQNKIRIFKHNIYTCYIVPVLAYILQISMQGTLF